MSKPKILIFVDGLPYHKKEIFKDYLSSTVRCLEVGLGFSSNMHCVLLAGKSPDEMGFFTDWTITDYTVGRRYLTHRNTFGYVVNKLVGRLRGYSHSIPLGLGNKFMNTGVYPLKNKKSLCDLNVCFEDWDFYIDDEASVFLKEQTDIVKNTVLVLNHIDTLGHYQGTDSLVYENACQSLFSLIKERIEDKYEYLLFSDHGMSRNPKGVSLVLEDYVGRQSSETYFYFIDSTSIKVWSKNEEIKDKLKLFLGSMKEGVLLSNEQRKKYGVECHSFGDIIFILKNEFYFKDNYFGRSFISKTKGMHGNWPDHPEQCGVVISNQISNSHESIHFRDFHTNFLVPFID